VKAKTQLQNRAVLHSLNRMQRLPLDVIGLIGEFVVESELHELWNWERRAFSSIALPFFLLQDGSQSIFSQICTMCTFLAETVLANADLQSERERDARSDAFEDKLSDLLDQWNKPGGGMAELVVLEKNMEDRWRSENCWLEKKTSSVFVFVSPAHSLT
jgi:hypothetical protein